MNKLLTLSALETSFLALFDTLLEKIIYSPTKLEFDLQFQPYVQISNLYKQDHLLLLI